MPAKGMRLSAKVAGAVFPASHVPGSIGSAGKELRSSQKMAITRNEKMTPATAAAFGVRSLARDTPACCAIELPVVPKEARDTYR